MCGVAGVVALDGREIPDLRHRLEVMAGLLAHRGPDGSGFWCSPDGQVGLAHRRLSVIDLSERSAQPMVGEDGCVLTFNGEIYNYRELRRTLADDWRFRSEGDTEVILAAHAHQPSGFLESLRGMFAFAIWDPGRRELLAVRDRFGIKPFYYSIVDEVLYFASEAKAVLPFLPSIETDPQALGEYLTFQLPLADRTMFAGVRQLQPGMMLTAGIDGVRVGRYWDVHFDLDHDHSAAYFHRRTRELLEESVELHLRSDVGVGAYVSGGVDSSLVAILARTQQSALPQYFHGTFTEHPGYDERDYASLVADRTGGELHSVDITAQDFIENIRDVIYHLDYPVAGPGSFPQFMVSELASRSMKVVLGGQGGDEVFGGYARYLLAYFEQCIKAAIDGTYQNGNYVVTIESIVPNLGLLREYVPLMRRFWSEGLFGPIEERYLRLIDRSVGSGAEIDWDAVDRDAVVDTYRSVFSSPGNVGKGALFDAMTHFDFKTLLPALLHVEDRMSMAHGLESRVPLLDHPLVEFAATVPADVKFEGGRSKRLLKDAFAAEIPPAIADRRDKMGFPVPLSEWAGGPLRTFVEDTLDSMASNARPGIDPAALRAMSPDDGRFSRRLWGLLSMELWYQTFHDRSAEWRRMATHV